MLSVDFRARRNLRDTNLNYYAGTIRKAEGTSITPTSAGECRFGALTVCGRAGVLRKGWFVAGVEQG